MQPYHILVSCFDVSADHHASRLIFYLNQVWKHRVTWSLLGGEELLALSRKHSHIHFLEATATKSTIGVLEGLSQAFQATTLFHRIKLFLQTGKYRNSPHPKPTPVDLFLAIDGQGRNISLGKIAHKLGIRTAYLFPPLVFVWGRWNTKKMKIFDHIFCPFKPNIDLYQKDDVRASYIPHPFVYYLMANPIHSKGNKKTPQKKTPQKTPLAFKSPTTAPLKLALKKTIGHYEITPRLKPLKESLNLKPHHWLITLFPGSRNQEINRLTPLFLQTLKNLLNHFPNGIPLLQKSGKLKYFHLRFALALSHEHFRPKVELFRKQANLTPHTLPIIHDSYEELLYLSRIAITCSGTVTFKAAFLGTPHILTYQISTLSYWVFRTLLQFRFIGMLNILVNKPIIPELINQSLSVKSLTHSLTQYLTTPNSLENKRHELIDLISTLYRDKHSTHPFEAIQKQLSPFISSPSKKIKKIQKD